MKRIVITAILSLALTAFAIQAVEQTSFSGAGIIESTSGGFRFPDGSVQTSAAPVITETFIYQSGMPYVITSSGTYALAENLAGVSGQNGITISSDNVTIDLNGYELLGVSGSLSGITYGAGIQNVVVKNGAISNWGEDGIKASFGSSKALLIENILVSNNGSEGIWSVVAETVVRDCILDGNGAAGLWATASVTVTGCRSTNNASSGIRGDSEAVIIGNVCLSNGLGINTDPGIMVFGNARVENNTLNANHHGINVYGSGNIIVGNSLVANVNRGFNVIGTGNLIIKNIVSGSTVNFDIAAGNDVGPIEAADASVSPVANIEF